MIKTYSVLPRMHWEEDFTHIEIVLAERKIITDGKFLDLGTGPATQAMWLAEKGLRL